MKTHRPTSEPNSTFPWDAQSVAPSLALTADWWNQSARLDPLSESLFDESEDSNRGPRTQVAHRCPACGAIVYSRRHRVCGICARPLPSESIFSESESLRVQRVVQIERERHRQWLARSQRS